MNVGFQSNHLAWLQVIPILTFVCLKPCWRKWLPVPKLFGASLFLGHLQQFKSTYSFLPQGQHSYFPLAKGESNRCQEQPWRGDRLPTPVFMGFPGGSAGKGPACSVGDLGWRPLIPGLGRCPRGGMATHSSILAWRSPVDRGAWRVTVPGVAKTQTQLSDCRQCSRRETEAGQS